MSIDERGTHRELELVERSVGHGVAAARVVFDNRELVFVAGATMSLPS